MKFLILAISLILAGAAFAGGSTGGNPGVIAAEELMQLAFNSRSLPKLYAEGEDFRRAEARLSVKDCQPVELNIEGDTVKVRKLLKSIVTADGSKEVLPADALGARMGR